MTVKTCIIILFLIITLLLLVVSIRNIRRPSSEQDIPSRIIILLLTTVSTVITFVVPWALPDSIANTKIEYLDGHIIIDQPSTADESELSIESFQVTGDSSTGIANVKFHISSNFYLLNGKITLYGVNGPISVGYNIPSATCTSTTSSTNFAISFPEMKSNETYTAEIVAEDISGKIITKPIEFTAY